MIAALAIPPPPKSTTGITSATLAQMIAEHGAPTMRHRDDRRPSYSWVKGDLKITFYPARDRATLEIQDIKGKHCE